MILSRLWHPQRTWACCRSGRSPFRVRQRSVNPKLRPDLEVLQEEGYGKCNLGTKPSRVTMRHVCWPHLFKVNVTYIRRPSMCSPVCWASELSAHHSRCSAASWTPLFPRHHTPSSCAVRLCLYALLFLRVLYCQLVEHPGDGVTLHLHAHMRRWSKC